jgi:hypothetical protein
VDGLTDLTGDITLFRELSGEGRIDDPETVKNWKNY